MSSPAAAVAILEVPDAQVLVLRRRRHERDPWSGHWSLPGGRLEAGEAPMCACRREVYEEVGWELSSEPVRRQPDALAGRAVGHALAVAVFVWRMREPLPAVRLEPREHDRAHWLPLSAFATAQHHPVAALAPLRPQERYPFISIDGTPLWGFTYQVLHQWWKDRSASACQEVG
ncbi:MAG: NUDIX domain-containing protein [Planctomycetota bacterium]